MDENFQEFCTQNDMLKVERALSGEDVLPGFEFDLSKLKI